MEKLENLLIGCSEEHSAAIGAYGQLYVWGSNMFYDEKGYKKKSKLEKEKVTEDNKYASEDDSDSPDNMSKIIIEKLGFCNDLNHIIDPTYLNLAHPLYKVNCSQIACGFNFTAVIAKEKPNVLQSGNDSELLFSLETDDRALDFVPNNYKELREEDFNNAILANKVRIDITEFLSNQKLDFMSFFKSPIIKEYTFLDLMKNSIKTSYPEVDLKRLIQYKKMNMPGNDLKLKPLYELVMKTKQGEGILYILGTEDIIPKDSLNQKIAHNIKDINLNYYIINLPSQVICQKVCCGKNFVLILSSTGLVYSWGETHTPALGKNRAASYSQIRGVSGLVTDKLKVVDIACGFSHCIAQTNTNIVLTWGEGENGKLGNGRNDACSRPEPINLDSRDPAFIKAFGNTSFCMMKDGTGYFWGENLNNQFGPEFPRKYYDKGIPLITKFTPIVDIAIATKAVVYIERSGQLNQINKEGESSLSKRGKFLEGAEFYQITCHKNTFFALSKKGSIFSWTLEKSCKNLGRDGDPLIPQEIHSCTQQFPKNEEKEDVFEEHSNYANNLKSTKILKCFSTEENTLLLTDKGEVLATGSNEYGQMGIAHGDLDSFGDDLPGEFDEFIMVPRLSRSFKINVKKIFSGMNHVFALVGTKLLAWGCNSSGQLGVGIFSHSQKYPEMVKGLDSHITVQAAAGLTHSLVLTEDGKVFSFGSAESGKLGQGMLNDSISIAEPKQVKALKNVKNISCSVGHSMAVTLENKLFSWGDNYKGQLGNGNKTTEYVPKEILGFINWKVTACGPYHSLGLSKENKLYHWGQVNYPDEESELLRPTPAKGMEEISIAKVYAAEGYSAALVTSGASVHVWGKQLHKRLIGAKPEVLDNQIIKSIFSVSNEKILSFTISSLHGCIVTDQNSVFTWGYPANGRLGESSSNIEDKVFNGNFLNLTKYLGIVDVASAEGEEIISDLQMMLQNEPEELSESNIREVDKQIALKFRDCIDMFIQLTEDDEKILTFMEQVKYKMLSRLQQKPLDCILVENQGGISAELDSRLIMYGSLITTYQVHPCYTYKLLFDIKLENKLKLDMFNLIYSDIENNEKLIYTCMYLSQMVLEKSLNNENATFENLLETPDGQIYREIVVKMILSSNSDMAIMRELANECLLNLSNQVNQDELGIDMDPISAGRTAQSNKISAYQNNRNIVDRRMGKLKNLVAFFSNHFYKMIPANESEHKLKRDFSPMISLVTKNFLTKCSKKFKFKLLKFDPQLDHIKKASQIVLELIFSPICQAINEPHEFYLIIENKIACSKKNLSSLSDAIRGYLNGKPIGDSGDRWLADINKFNVENPESQLRKVKTVEHLYSFKYDLEELYLESFFKDSLKQFDSIISVNGREMIKLHSITDKNFNLLRVNNPSYDPLLFLCRELETVPSIKIFSPSECVNLTLFTRALRQDQSIVRCTCCQMLIPREMAPSNFKPVIEIYDPMPPNSPVFLYTRVLASSCKKLKKGRIDDFLKKYQLRCEKYLKDYKAVESVNYLINLVNTNIAAINEIPIDTADNIQLNFIDLEREKVLKNIEKQCEKEYLRRRHHRKLQENLTRIFNKLLNMLSSYKSENFFSNEHKKDLIFNVEYGGANRELEKFSDSVMFSIYLNKIHDYTMKKEMSISLFENLKGKMNESLKGFMKRSLPELKRKKFFASDPILPSTMKEKNIIFSFEVDNGCLIIIVVYSPGRLNICGRDEFRHEELLIYIKVDSSELSKIRDEVKAGGEYEP